MTNPATAEVPVLPKIEPWSVEQLRAGLVSTEHDQRIHALAMSVQPNAPVDDIVGELGQCVDACHADPIALQVAAAALSLVTRASEKVAATNILASLATTNNALAVRVFAAHGFAQLALVPQQAWPSIVRMLLDPDATLRQVALRAATPFAPEGAAQLAQTVAETSPDKWTSEALAALALSAGTSHESKQRIEQFVLRALQGQTLFPAGVAGYAALARLNPSGVAPQALAKIAGSEDDATALAAIIALSQLGEGGSGGIPGLVEALVQTEKPEREEALCRALVTLRIDAEAVPVQRVVQRIESGPDRAAAAHAVLVALHAKSFSSVAPLVALRHSKSSVALQPVLNELHFQLSGSYLVEPKRFTASPTQS